MRVFIEWQYKTKQGYTTQFQSELLPIEEAIMLIEDIEKTGRIGKLTIIDEYDSTWTLKNMKKYMQELVTLPHDITLYFDAGFHHKTMLAGLGIVIYFTQDSKLQRIRKNACLEQIISNNEAEYAALQFALNELENIGVTNQTITIKGDAQVVINQLNGEWPAYEDNLIRWIDKIESQLKRLELQPNYEFIP